MALNKNVPDILQKEKIEFVIVNGENAAGGFGITKKICEEFYDLGVDAITTGNHVWDQREIIQHIEKDSRLIRPCNFAKNTPGRGYGVYQLKSGTKIIVVNVMCRLFMESLENPFLNLENIIDEVNLLSNDHLIIVDVHGESTSEKNIKDFASERLAPFKVPRKILFLDEIPKGATGKLQRIGLAEKLGLTD